MKQLFILSLFLLVSSISFAQGNEKRAYKANEVVNFGFDFTSLKLIHEDGFITKNGKPMCKSFTFKYFEEWNELWILEENKYNLADYFGIKKSSMELDIATERNSTYPDENCIITDESYKLSDDQVKEIVSAYKSTEKEEGLGFLIIVESMSKENQRAMFYTVFFDLATNEIERVEYLKGDPGGYGFRNYWAGALHEGLDRTSKDFKKMRKK